MTLRPAARVSCLASLGLLGLGVLAITACDPVPPPCTAGQLHLSSAALPNFTSHRVFAVIVTNAGGAACSVNDFPGVSFLAAGGSPVGGAAEWEPANSVSTGPVTLTTGASASALLIATVAGVWDPSACGPILHGTTLRVYPPGSTTALTTPLTLDVCTAPIGLTVGPFQPGINPAP